jgi:peptide/nickel transport system permease protein
MISIGRDYVTSQWWMATFPGLAISFTVLGFNLLGDGLRDMLDVEVDE